MRQRSLVLLQDAVASLGGEILGSIPPALRDAVTVRCSAGHEFSSQEAGIVYLPHDTAQAHEPGQPEEPRSAAVLVSVLALSLGGAVIKRASVSLPLWQLYVLRSALIVPVLASAIALRATPTSFRPLVPSRTLLRSLLLALMWIAYYAALPQIELSVATRRRTTPRR